MKRGRFGPPYDSSSELVVQHRAAIGAWPIYCECGAHIGEMRQLRISAESTGVLSRLPGLAPLAGHHAVPRYGVRPGAWSAGTVRTDRKLIRRPDWYMHVRRFTSPTKEQLVAVRMDWTNETSHDSLFDAKCLGCGAWVRVDANDQINAGGSSGAC